jgi:hypothetical protein
MQSDESWRLMAAKAGASRRENSLAKAAGGISGVAAIGWQKSGGGGAASIRLAKNKKNSKISALWPAIIHYAIWRRAALAKWRKSAAATALKIQS